ncbi:MAG TPA: hypothetical protein VMH30_02390 [Verrucomicrobiae bacterium]|nr:hypothetical protein [Verrucomicrobiae bacterium]
MDDALMPAATRFDPQWLEIFIVIGAIFLVCLGTFFWAAFIRKPKNRRRKYRQHHKGYREKLKTGADGIMTLVDKRRRRHWRIHRPQNPTLAQTGGLPPRRESNGQTPPDAT